MKCPVEVAVAMEKAIVVVSIELLVKNYTEHRTFVSATAEVLVKYKL